MPTPRSAPPSPWPVALGVTVEELFGRGELADPVQARPAAPAGPGERVTLATVGHTSWREGLVVRPSTAVTGLRDVARLGLDLTPAELPGYDSRVSGHLQVAAAIAGRRADAGVSSEPAALAYGLHFIPLAAERFDLVIPAKLAAAPEVLGLLKVLTSPWLLT
jgi:hypothetical protein